MSRVAAFVDAGYLFAQGSVALSGEKRPRSETRLNETAIVAELSAVGQAKCPGVRPLRTYWYDAPLGSGPTAQHIALAGSDYVKLRLGAINVQGQQKGVDSLIVTDLIELARNKSISDAVLLSGDEDVRIGVQIAQSFGVSVHLIGLHPARGSQSQALRQEADTNTEWDSAIIARFLAVTAPKVAAPAPEASASTEELSTKALTQKVVTEIVDAFSSDDIVLIGTYWQSGAVGLPSEVDRPLLGKLRDAHGRTMTRDELRWARQEVERCVKKRTQAAG